MTKTTVRGTVYYMSPELLQIYARDGFGEFSPEKSDTFSLGLTFLRLSLSYKENQI